MTPAPRTSSPNAQLDGIRPLHAACEACHYEFAGISVRDGAITCPECGYRNPLDFPPVDRSPLLLLRIMRVTLLVLAGVALITLLLWMSGAAALLKASSGH
jgi:hypothetical protein